MPPLERRVLGASGAHQSWADRRHEDAGRSELRAESLGKADERELARAVRQEMRDTHLAADGGDVDDAPLTPRPHMRQHRQDDVERTPEVRGHVALEVGGGHDADGPNVDHPGIVDQHIDRTEAGVYRANQLRHLVAIAHVAGQGKCGHARPGEVLARAFECVGVAAADRDARPRESGLSR